MFYEYLLELLLIAAAVERATAYAKPWLAKLAIADDTRHAITMLMSVAFGLFAAFGSEANVFAMSPVYNQMPQWFGMVVTGVLMGLGSNSLHAIYDILAGWHERPERLTVTSGVVVAQSRSDEAAG